MPSSIGQKGQKAGSGKGGRVGFRAALLLAPSALILIIFTLWPMVVAVYHSLFFSDNAHPVPVFAGLANFTALGRDPVFAQVMRNTVLFILGTVPVSMLIAMVLAVALNRRYRLTPFFRLALFHPVVLPMVSAASIWLFMYTPDYGIVDKVLALFGGPQINWLGEPGTALPAIMLMTIWKQVGYFMIFYLAGLQNIGQDPYEAAAVDGAGPVKAFRSITVPLLMPTSLFVFIIAMVDAFQMIDQLYVMTQGGPSNGTNMLLYYIYQQAFAFSNLGKASALSVILIVILLAVAVLQTLADKRVHYES
ncbi:Binding-protein-dependent transport system inner membrane component [Acididesulfobacillus acetoxydans]|uniref:Binding-protein-dependent transport system inner membrane component n=1 Tax=Acididesulfobacillus acetoxydans TaxID=1561005 RepID=A0A8S0WVF7_9FIRM|nr:sugar ABC transporter permease [Acididesulfobacillus acetoxydans]CAA7599551.1 Binding-protein-dependent transport system inner membrane component [Acididesulfobacillus acetoxydans]CEJ07746.1 Lactose transport system permease protein LacF [Acididesulfobacillus acetoxydans]